MNILESDENNKIDNIDENFNKNKNNEIYFDHVNMEKYMQMLSFSSSNLKNSNCYYSMNENQIFLPDEFENRDSVIDTKMQESSQSNNQENLLKYFYIIL